MQGLTPRQQQILEMIQSHINTTGMPPTRTDICDYFGFRSPTAADDHLKALERKGAIELVPGTSRGIRIVQTNSRLKPSGAQKQNQKTTRKIHDLPVVGRVAAGEPITSEEHIEDYHQIDPNLFNPRADYLLRVRGMSMRDAGILDGDLLAVHSTSEAYNRQIVVARVDDEVTVKRFRQRGNIVTLLPENEDFDPIRVDLREQDFSIEGIYAGILRLKEDGSSA